MKCPTSKCVVYILCRKFISTENQRVVPKGSVSCGLQTDVGIILTIFIQNIPRMSFIVFEYLVPSQAPTDNSCRGSSMIVWCVCVNVCLFVQIPTLDSLSYKAKKKHLSLIFYYTIQQGI